MGVGKGINIDQQERYYLLLTLLPEVSDFLSCADKKMAFLTWRITPLLASPLSAMHCPLGQQQGTVCADTAAIAEPRGGNGAKLGRVVRVKRQEEALWREIPSHCAWGEGDAAGASLQASLPGSVCRALGVQRGQTPLFSCSCRDASLFSQTWSRKHNCSDQL